MSSNPMALVNNHSDIVTPVSDIIHLRELGICVGRLDNIIECDQEDFALALIEDMTVEIPIAHAPVMRPMVGQRIWLAMVKGQLRAEVMT